MAGGHFPGDRHGPVQPLLERVRAAPWRFGFIPLLRRLAAGQGGKPPIGRAVRPRQEGFRLGQSADLAFAPREIAEVVLPPEVGVDSNATEDFSGPAGPVPLPGNNPAVPLLRLFGLGMLGPNGPLPLHDTEWVRERSRNHRDGTSANFLDVFHHRYLTQMYRAWAQGQAAAGLDRPDDETFSAYIARLTGHDPQEIRDSALPSHARLSASAHLSQGSRHADGLVQTLTQFFRVPVRLEEFWLHWIPVDETDRSCLGETLRSSLLGIGAVAGERVPDRQGKFRLVFGPLTLPRYERFMPGGADLPVLVEWVRAFVGLEFAWELELRVLSDEAPSARLETTGEPAGPRLGWSTWLGEARWAASRIGAGPCDHATGLVFEPECVGAGPPGRLAPETASAHVSTTVTEETP